MNCVLFAKMDQVFTLKNSGKVEKKGKVMEFCQSGKVGSLSEPLRSPVHICWSQFLQFQDKTYKITTICFKIESLVWNKFPGPTGIRTRIAGFKVQSAGHYTIGPYLLARLFPVEYNTA